VTSPAAVSTPTPNALAFLDEALAALEARHLRRPRRRFRDRPPAEAPALFDDGSEPAILTLTSNDYLAYTGLRSEYPDTDRDYCRTGAGASRLIDGTTAEHDGLEDALAAFLERDDALVFSSGYAANLGLVSSLAGPSDLVVSDRLNHASIIDGCRLSRAEIAVVPHLDVAAVEQALVAHRERNRPNSRAFVVTESYFSMDGDVPDLVALRALTHRFEAALLVDEAHALGVFGPSGRGLCHARGVVPDATVGTFGKSVGASGAFVAGSFSLIEWLWNRARSFVFSTGISPILARTARRGLTRMIADDLGRERLLSHARRLREGLTALGYEVPATSLGPIVPVLIGDAARALAVADDLAREGVRVVAIRPPTVPEGTSRLRITVHAGLTESDLDRALEAFGRARRQSFPTPGS
jgi:8-amino-7-oxononanoate synthase